MDVTRKGQIRPAGRLLKKLVAPALRKHGFAEADVVTRWATIVGPLLAEHCVPDRLRQGADGGTLQITVDGSYALELQHLQPVIIDRVNSYFGYRAVARLSMRQAPLEIVAKRRTPPAPPSDAAVAEIGATLPETLPGPLRDALMQLGGRILGDEFKTKGKTK